MYLVDTCRRIGGKICLLQPGPQPEDGDRSLRDVGGRIPDCTAILLLLLLFKLQMDFCPWQWYYNKTQHTDAHITQTNTPQSNETQHTKPHKQQRTH
jgi:hypothetical protein